MSLITFSVFSQTWMQLNSGTNSDLMEINGNPNPVVFCFGDSAVGPTFVRGVVLKTTDKGANWNQQNMISPNYKILDSYFFNANSGIAVGRHNTLDGIVCRTANGGGTWVVDSTFVERIHTIHFSGSNTGWIAGRNGYAAKTINGGLNWTPLTTGTGNHLNGIFFTDSNNGYAVGDQGGVETILHSVNGGSSWLTQGSGIVENMNAIWCSSPGECWAAGNAGTIIYTSDSGNTWTPQASNVLEDLLDIQFLNVNEGWAAGTAGTLLHTTDGGVTWTPQTSNTTNDIQSISMVSNQEGWFCGNNGDIYYYGLSMPNSVFDDAEYGSHVVSVFPNPAHKKVTFKMLNNVSPESIRFYDITGREIFPAFTIDDKQLNVSFDEFSSGMVFFLLTDKNNNDYNGIIILN